MSESAVPTSPETRAEVEEHAATIRRSLLRYDPLQMVVNLYSYAMMRFRESTHFYEFPYVEYVALLYWQPRTQGETEELTEDAITTTYHEVGKLFFEVRALYRTEAEHAEERQDIEELALGAKLAGLMIRNPAAEQHHKAVLAGLFEPFEDDVRSVLGFAVRDVLSCLSVVHDAYEDARGRFKEDVEAASARGDPVSFVHRFAEYFPFTASDLSAKCKLPEAVVELILRSFSIEPGEAADHVLLPSPFSVLHEKPFLRFRDGDRYFVPNLSLLLPCIKLHMENLLNPNLNAAAPAGLWTRYERYRGKWVENETDRLIRKMIPGGNGAVGVYYEVGGVRVEGDVLYEADDLVILAEGKSGAIAPATFRGAPGSLARDIRDIIKKGHRQTLRTAEYILAGNRRFSNSEGGEAYTIRARTVREILRIVVTLAPSDFFATAGATLMRAGFMPGEPTWVLSLTDLMVVAECLALPAAVRHYARQRYKAITDERLITFDETDYLTTYLAINQVSPSGVDDAVTILTGFGSQLDAHYIYRERDEPPHQKMAREVVSLIEALQASQGSNWTHAICDMLSLDSKSRGELSENIAILSRRTKRDPGDFTMGKKGVWNITIVMCDGADPERLREAFIERISHPGPDVGPRLVIAYDQPGGRADAEYYQRVEDRYYRTPPSLFWKADITKR